MKCSDDQIIIASVAPLRFATLMRKIENNRRQLEHSNKYWNYPAPVFINRGISLKITSRIDLSSADACTFVKNRDTRRTQLSRTPRTRVYMEHTCGLVAVDIRRWAAKTMLRVYVCMYVCVCASRRTFGTDAVFVISRTWDFIFPISSTLIFAWNRASSVLFFFFNASFYFVIIKFKITLH